MKKGILILSLVASFTQYLVAQDFTLYNMPYLQQRFALNPSFIPESKIQIGLPFSSSIGASFSNSGFAWSDVFDPSGDSLTIGSMIDGLKDENNFTLNTRSEIIAGGFKLGNNYLNISVSERAQATLTYPDGLFKFIWEGNGANVEEDLNFSFKANAIHYREYALGYSRVLGDKLTIGGRMKYMYGLENITTSKSNISLSTDADSAYALTLSSDIELLTSGISNPEGTTYFFGRKNTGVAFDLGANFNITERLSINASALNLGAISWKNDVKNRVSANPNTSYTYNGLPINVLFDGDSALTEALEQLVDSAEALLVLDSNSNAYKTTLPAQFHLAANFRIIKGQNAGLHLVLNTIDGTSIPAYSFYYGSSIGKWFTATMTYNIYNGSFTNLGLGLRFNGGPFQVYAVTDNVFSLVTPQHGKYFSARTGINFTFGNGNKTIKNDK